MRQIPFNHHLFCRVNLNGRTGTGLPVGAWHLLASFTHRDTAQDRMAERRQSLPGVEVEFLLIEANSEMAQAVADAVR